ncbi:MAG: hypothetical protein ACRD03_05815, partial [Acidimicrobiales bacterium]
MAARPATREAVGGGRPSRLVARLRSSLLVKILAGLVVAVVGSSTLTALVETTLTRDALDTQSRRITAGDLRVLDQAYAGRERRLVGDLRNLEEVLVGRGLLAEDRRTELISELSGLYRNHELDLLEVLGPGGRPLQPPVRAPAVELRPGAAGPAGDRPTVTSRLLATTDGGWVQAVMVPIGTGDDPHLLIGGYRFGDEFALRLRGSLGELSHVVLVVDGDVVGSTLAVEPTLPPGVDGPDDALPTAPVAER